jgi:hypothetical protein
MKASSTTETDRIEKALMTTGFPLELKVAEILRRREYEIYGNQFFEIDDKIKEIDMEAWIPVKIPDSYRIWCLNPEIVIECKMSKKYSWVFHRSHTVVGHSDLAQGIDAITLKHGHGHGLLGDILSFEHYYESHVAGTFAVLDVERGRLSERDEVFDSTSKLSQFVNYRVENLMRYFGHDRRDILFFFPVLVFDGMIYEADYDGGELSILPIDSIVLEARTISPITGRLAPMYVDIVTSGHFENHLGIIEREIKLASRHLNKDAVQASLNNYLSPKMRQRSRRKR